MPTLPGLLTFAALSLVALVAGVSLTRLVPALASQHPGLIALGLLLLFWTIRERWMRSRLQARLIAEIDGLTEELMHMRGEIPPPAMSMPPAIALQTGALQAGTLPPANAAVAREAANESAREPRLVMRDIAAAPEPADDGSLLEAVRDALNNNRVELHIQPIVSLPQRRIRFFELLARPRDAEGQTYRAAECLDALEAAGLRDEFDALMLLRSVQLVRKLEQRAKDVGFFLNLSPAMLAQIETFNPLYDFLQREREHAANIVLEFGHAGIAKLDRAGLYRLSRLAALGFAISVDGIDRFDVDFALLAKNGVRFVKFDAAAFGDAGAIARSPIDLADLPEICQRHNLVPVLGKVENEQELLKLSDLDFPFGQGMLFGIPKLARAA
ncbi:EAL domain-containing protein [Ferrovibrio sp.]|uniref:EAL domain-containing protein n=1 Tax=Ferrovibrio sp. TaxID=1917215 RepID=UPI002636C83C|nr:EAL domain-containing protein [Ferrovibrio sp.]